MTTRTRTLSAQPQLLRYALLSDSIISAVFSVICIFDTELLGTLLGFQAPAVFIGFGLFGIAYAATLFYVVQHSPINRPVAWFASIGNLSGALAIAVILLIGVPPLTITAKWTLAIVADVVAVLGLLQFFGLRQTRN